MSLFFFRRLNIAVANPLPAGGIGVTSLVIQITCPFGERLISTSNLMSPCAAVTL